MCFAIIKAKQNCQGLNLLCAVLFYQLELILSRQIFDRRLALSSGRLVVNSLAIDQTNRLSGSCVFRCFAVLVLFQTLVQIRRYPCI